MRIGILSQVTSKQDMESFKKSAKSKNIDIHTLTSSSLVITIKNGTLALLDSSMNPVILQGIINWEPYPVFEEVEKACNCLRIPFINSIEAVRTARNKMLTSIALSHFTLPQPDTVYYNNPTANQEFVNQLAFPLVSKPKAGTQGRGALKCNSLAEFNRLVGAKISKNGVYLQRFVPNGGWDIRVVVVGGHIVGAIKKIAAPGEWRTHVLYGGKTEPFVVDKELEQLSLLAAKALGLHFAGIDVIVDNTDGKYKILEVNAVPGLKVFQKTTGTCIANEVLQLISGYVLKC